MTVKYIRSRLTKLEGKREKNGEKQKERERGRPRREREREGRKENERTRKFVYDGNAISP